MNGVLKNLDAKTITSVGGVIISLALIGMMWRLMSEALDKYAVLQTETNKVLRDNVKAIEGNTEVIRSLRSVILKDGEFR